MSEAREPRLYPNQFADAEGAPGPGPDHDRCDCVPSGRKVPTFHRDRQDTSAPGWLHLLELIDEAAADGRALFRPLVDLSAEERRQVVTLPASIGTLTEVRHLVLYGSNLVRIPPEIGAMTNLEVFEPYTSYRLHWYPYELTRCSRLQRSTVSTRALYGSRKFRGPFPRLQPGVPAGEHLDPGVTGTETARTCSVCDRPLEAELHQAWISLVVATDVLPLLVNACSDECLRRLPAPHPGYVPFAHQGGPDVDQSSL